MKTVRISIDDLKVKLEENLALHDEVYEEAIENYWKTVGKAFKEQVVIAEETIRKRNIEHGGINLYVSINAPTSNREAYEDALAMLSYETRDIVELSHNEFKSYILNQWDWSNQFLASNALYASQEKLTKFSNSR